MLARVITRIDYAPPCLRCADAMLPCYAITPLCRRHHDAAAIIAIATPLPLLRC